MVNVSLLLVTVRLVRRAIAIDAIINQKDYRHHNRYIRSNRSESFYRSLNVVRKLEEHGAMANTIFVVATASEAAALTISSTIRWLLPWVNTSVTVVKMR